MNSALWQRDHHADVEGLWAEKVPADGEPEGIEKAPLKTERWAEREPLAVPDAGPERIIVKVLPVTKASKLKTVVPTVKVPVRKPSGDWVATEMAAGWVWVEGALAAGEG